MQGKVLGNDNLKELSINKDKNGGIQYKLLKSYGQTKSLVFISHRQADSRTAKDIAYFLTSNGIDVFLEALESLGNNAEYVTQTIDFGLNASTHLLAIISNNTKGSWWVPYEVGVARNRPIPCGMLILDTVTDLPEYLRTTNIIKDSFEMAAWANQIPGKLIAKSYSEAIISRLPSIRVSMPDFMED